MSAPLLPNGAFGISVTFAPPQVAFGLRFSAKFAAERAKYSTHDSMRDQWQSKLRVALKDNSLCVVQLLSGSVIAQCTSNMPPQFLAQNFLALVKSPTPVLPPPEGFAVNWSSGAQPAWLSPNRLRSLLLLESSIPSISQMQPSPPLQEPAVVVTKSPLTHEDFEALASEFDDQATLERLRSDKDFCPWKGPV